MFIRLATVSFDYFSFLRECLKQQDNKAVVVAQLAARSLLIPEDPGSNPVIGNFYWKIIYC